MGVRLWGVFTLPSASSMSEIPKSDSSRRQLPLSVNSRLSGLVSLWIMPTLCSSLRLRAVRVTICRIASPLPLKSQDAVEPSAQYSMSVKLRVSPPILMLP